jgi:copper chaperone CopZ
MTTATIQTSGTHCPSCSMLIELTVDEIDGVSKVQSDHATGVTTVEYDPQTTTPAVLAEAIRSAGYGADIIA